MDEQLAALGHPERRARTVPAVRTDPARFAPPVLYALASALFADGEREDGAFWLYAAQVRARFDANRCADPGAGVVVDLLNDLHGEPINRWSFTDPPRLRAIVGRAVDWDRATPHDYDHGWIHRLGMDASLGGAPPRSRPPSEWDGIAERTRVDYLRGLEEALASLP